MPDAVAPPTIQIDTIAVHDVTFDETVGLIAQWGGEGSGGYVTTPNVDHVVRARGDAAFRSIVARARLRVPDGMGIVYGSWLAGTPLRGSVTGRLLPEALASSSREAPLPMALLGGRADAVVKAAASLTELGGEVVAAISPPMGFEIGGAEDAAAVAELQAAGPRIVFVGLGAPKQERWMSAHRDDLPQAVMIGIGYAIDVLGGATPAAPRWMTRVGLEWAFRMLRDPRRIARRVFLGTPRFMWWMLRQRFERLKRRRLRRPR